MGNKNVPLNFRSLFFLYSRGMYNLTPPPIVPYAKTTLLSVVMPISSWSRLPPTCPQEPMGESPVLQSLPIKQPGTCLL